MKPISRSLRTWLSAAALACACGAATGCTNEATDEASPEACAELRDHLGGLYASSVPAPRTDEVTADLAKHAASASAALGDKFVADCTSRRSADYIDCALATSTMAELAGCDR